MPVHNFVIIIPSWATKFSLLILAYHISLPFTLSLKLLFGKLCKRNEREVSWRMMLDFITFHLVYMLTNMCRYLNLSFIQKVQYSSYYQLMLNFPGKIKFYVISLSFDIKIIRQTCGIFSSSHVVRDIIMILAPTHRANSHS